MNKRLEMVVDNVSPQWSWHDNWLACRFSKEFRVRNASYLVPVMLWEKESISQAHQIPSHMYFPLDCTTVQISGSLKNGSRRGVAMTGFDGMVNIEVLCGSARSVWTSAVVGRGSALRIPIEIIAGEFDANRRFRSGALAYLRFLLFQASQSAVCYRHHSIEQELCRWLLTVQDLVRGDVIRVTHQTIADHLGIRRETVTVAAIALQDSGFIENGRGALTISDRDGIERRACECYHSIGDERRRLTPASATLAPASAAIMSAIGVSSQPSV